MIRTAALDTANFPYIMGRKVFHAHLVRLGTGERELDAIDGLIGLKMPNQLIVTNHYFLPARESEKAFWERALRLHRNN